MTLPTITALPTAPSRLSSPDTFTEDADAFMGALPGFATELNQFGEAVVDANYRTTSETGLAIATGTKVFTIEADKAFSAGQFVVAASAADVTNFMFGQVTAHNSETGSLTVEVELVGGSGTLSDWIIGLSGPRGTAEGATLSANNTFSGANIFSGFIGVGSPTELTISSGAVTATSSRHTIDTEADASADDLDTINGAVDGNILILSVADGGRDVTLKDNTGNLRLAGDFTLSGLAETIVLMARGGSAWIELSRSDNV